MGTFKFDWSPLIIIANSAEYLIKPFTHISVKNKLSAIRVALANAFAPNLAPVVA